MKKSDSRYLQKRFQMIADKGLDKVRREKIHGTTQEIEANTLHLMKNNKKRFN